MSRTPHAFAAAENRIDRGKTKADRQRLAQEYAETAHSAANAILGGYSEAAQPFVCDAVLREFAARRKAASDAPALSGVLGAILGDLCREIPGPKREAKAEAEKAFKAKTGEAA